MTIKSDCPELRCQNVAENVLPQLPAIHTDCSHALQTLTVK
jgi:hypothetical protein